MFRELTNSHRHIIKTESLVGPNTEFCCQIMFDYCVLTLHTLFGDKNCYVYTPISGFVIGFANSVVCLSTCRRIP